MCYLGTANVWPVGALLRRNTRNSLRNRAHAQRVKLLHRSMTGKGQCTKALADPAFHEITHPMSMTRETELRTILLISLNGRDVETAARTIADLLAEQGYGDAKVATAQNGDFVPARARAATLIQAGDKIEVVSARQGG